MGTLIKGGSMKLEKEDYLLLKNSINNILEHDKDVIDDYEHGRFRRSNTVENLQIRFNWDLFERAGIRYKFNGYYDTHIETALKRVCPIITKKY